MSDMATKNKIILISSNQSLKDAIKQLLQSDNPSREIIMFDGGLDKFAEMASEHNPYLVIMEEMCTGAENLNALQTLSHDFPEISLILLCEKVSSDFLISSIRIGVKDVLKLPLVDKDLQTAVERVERRFRNPLEPLKKGKVIAFVSSKGGSGATFLACNLAYILAAESDAKVALIDLNLQFGDADLFLSSKPPSNTLADVATNISRLDASLLAKSMMHILPNFSLLASPIDAEHSAQVKVEDIDALLKLAIAQYDYLILDLGRVINATSVKAMDLSDKIFLVLQESLPYIRDSIRMIKAFRALGYSEEKIQPIINRYSNNDHIRLKDVVSAIGMNVHKTIPNSYKVVSESVNQGVPILEISKNDPVTKALQEIAKNLTNGTHVKKDNWLRSFMHSGQ